MAKRERELVFVRVIYPNFNAGHPVQERDDDYRDEVNEREVFANDCPDTTSFVSPRLLWITRQEKHLQDLPEIKTIALARWPDDASFEEDRDDPCKNDQDQGYGYYRSQPRKLAPLHDTNGNGSEEEEA